METKIFVGRKLRSLRDLHGLTQVKMASALEISPTYLNLLEHNNRHLSLNVLLKLGEKFDVDMKSFAIDESPELQTQLTKVFDDPITASTPISQRDIHDLAKDFPSASEAFIGLYDSYNRLHEKFNNGNNKRLGDVGVDPFNAAAKIFDVFRSDLDDLELSANQFRKELYELSDVATSLIASEKIGAMMNLFPLLSQYVDAKLGLRVRIIPANVMGSAIRRFDPHRREILLNKKLKKNARQFHLTVQTALISERDLFDKITKPIGAEELTSQSMLRTALAGYFAGVVITPEPPFIMSQVVRRESSSVKNSKNCFYFAAAFAALGNEFFTSEGF